MVIATCPVRAGSLPAAMVASLRLGQAGGLRQSGTTLVTLKHGALSTLRQRHKREEEVVMMAEGECPLVQDASETVMRSGDCPAFPAGDPDGPDVLNRSDRMAWFIGAGSRALREDAHRSDHDCVPRVETGETRFPCRDGSPWQRPR